MSSFQSSLPPVPTATPGPIAEEEEYYSSWSLFLVCVLLIISLWTSYYLQIKRIRAIHETLVSIVAGMFVGFVVRLAPGHLIREMLVSYTVTLLPVGPVFLFATVEFLPIPLSRSLFDVPWRKLILTVY